MAKLTHPLATKREVTKITTTTGSDNEYTSIKITYREGTIRNNEFIELSCYSKIFVGEELSGIVDSYMSAENKIKWAEECE